jgi:beta-galactosidase/beta-glucuronidase
MEIPRPEHPRPDFKREAWLNLNGRWQFEINSSGKRAEKGLKAGERFSQNIIVPFPPESTLSGIGRKSFMNSIWYRREFTVPGKWAGERVLLHFGAVDYEARAWVNGREVGHHRGGYTPFTCDVTGAISFDESNELVVNALDDNRTQLQASGKQSSRPESYGCLYTRVTGIWQTVWLESVPKAYISNFRLLPIEGGSRIYVEARAVGGREVADFRVTASLQGQTVASSRAKASSQRVALCIEAAGLKRWSPEDPTLYDLTLELSDSDEATDTVQSYLGIREVNIEGDVILLNDRRRFLRLVLDQGYYPDGIYTAPSDEALRRDIELAQEMGFDGARLHQKVFEPRYLYWADKLGYLVAGEYGDWGADLSNPVAREALIDEWAEVIERDFNHPSIVIWTPFNERSFESSNRPIADFLRRIYKMTRSLDPTRPVIDTSGYVHVATDIYDIHDYEQDPLIFRSHYEKFGLTGSDKDLWTNEPKESAAYTGQPVMISEYGGTWWNPQQPSDSKAWGYGLRPTTEGEFMARYRSLTESLLSNPRISAFCYTQLYDIEQEVNGLLSYDRRPKFNPREIEEINEQTAAME